MRLIYNFFLIIYYIVKYKIIKFLEIFEMIF